MGPFRCVAWRVEAIEHHEVKCVLPRNGVPEAL